MLKKTTIYLLVAAAIFAFVAVARRGETKFPLGAANGDVAAEAASVAEPERVEFLIDRESAFELARLENKPLLLFFASRNCKYSRALLDGAFSDPKIVELSRRFVCAEIDVNDPSAEDICAELSVSASPTIQFATSRGVPLQRLTQNQPASVLAAQMEAALTSVAWRESQTTTAREPQSTMLR